MLLLNGCCIKQMKKLQRQKIMVDAIVTDPPYHLTSIVERFGKDGSAPAQFGTDGAFKRASTGFMGKEWDGGDIAFDPMTWSLCLGLLKPGGHLIAFSASRNYHRMAVAIEDAGFEIRDQIMWIYGSGFPKSHNIGKAVDAIEKTGKSNPKALRETRMGDDYEPTGQEDYVKGRMFSSDIENDNHEHEVNNDWKGWGTALKPSHEPIVMARKPLSEKSIASNVLKWGTGAINIDGCRIEGNDAKYPDTNPDFKDVGAKSKEAIGIDKLSFGQTENVKRKRANRNPRNDDSVFNKSTTGFRSETQEFADADPRGRFPANIIHDGSDVVQDIFPNSKGFVSNGNAKVGEYSEGVINPMRRGNAISYGDDGSASRYFYCPKVSKSERHNSAIKNTHPTVKPIELMKYLCRLVTPKGGTVLDPFMGSGSTGMAAKDEGFDFIGIEKEREYYEIAEARIKKTAPLMDFFS